MISCPKCKGLVFKTGLHMCAKANVDYENGQITVYPVDNEVDSSLIQCANPRCGEKFYVNDPQVIHILTHPLVKCVECGREFTEEELDENNVCAICRVKKVDAGFANFEGADPFTLMRALAQVRIENLELSRKSESVQKDLQRAEEIHQVEDTEEEQTKPKRKRCTKAEMEAARAAENTDEDTVEIDDDSTEESDIEISEDEAPDLPTEVTDMSKAMNPPVED